MYVISLNTGILGMVRVCSNGNWTFGFGYVCDCVRKMCEYEYKYCVRVRVRSGGMDVRWMKWTRGVGICVNMCLSGCILCGRGTKYW